MEGLRVGEALTMVVGKTVVTSVMEVPSLLLTMLYNGKRYLYMRTIFDVKIKALVTCTIFSVSREQTSLILLSLINEKLYICAIIHNQLNTLLQNKNMTYYCDY